MSVRVAAIDCGTNSIRLLVCDLDAVRGEVAEVDRRTTIVRLGEGVDRTGVFAAAALARTFAAVDEYAEAIRDAGAERVRFVATSAARDVDNRAEFAAGIRARLGVDPEVVSGDEEARLSYDGATRGLRDRESGGGEPIRRPVVVVDIGGGSTEFVYRDGDSGPVRGLSLDIGSVRMTERHLHSDPPTLDEIASARADIDAALDRLDLSPDDVGTVVGVAGTVTTVAAMVLGLEAYDRDRIDLSVLPVHEVNAAVEALVAMTVEERRALGYMAPGRADVIGGGALIVGLTMRRLGAESLLVSEHDILDGIAWSMT